MAALGSSRIPRDHPPVPDAEKQAHLGDTKQGATDEVCDDGTASGTVYLQGRDFWLVTTSLSVMVLMVNLEVPVVTTSLVSITNDLSGFNNLSWIMSSYLLGYVAVIVIFAKLSDIFGRKPVYVLSMVIFIIFSAACSAAQTMPQLIIFRAFQGFGGGGNFSLSAIIITELVPADQYTKYVSQLTAISSLAMLVGPILGGAISSHTTWRWIFIINCPIAGTALFFTLIGMPRDFPYQGEPSRAPESLKKFLAKPTWDRVDLAGAVLLLLAVLALTAVLEEADSEFAWDSVYVITLLISGTLLWVLLLAWERYITRREGTREPVLPWRFFTNRIMVGLLLSFVSIGGPIIVPIFQLPQRFQFVNGLSGLDAGVRLMPFTALMPIGTIVAAAIARRFKMPPIYLVLAGACLQVVGFALLGKLPHSLGIPSRTYGFEAVAGFGVGMNVTVLFIIVPHAVEKRDQAVAMGAGNQFRMMGAAIAVAICTSVFNSHVQPQLASVLDIPKISSGSLVGLGQYLDSLPVEAQQKITSTLAEGYNRQMIVLCVFSAAQIPSALLMWKERQIRV